MKATKENINALYELDAKTPVQIRAILDEKVPVAITSIVDKKEVIKTVLFPKIGGVETRNIIARVAADKQRVIDDAQKVAEMQARYSVWESLGKPPGMLVNGRDGELLGFDMAAKVEGI